MDSVAGAGKADPCRADRIVRAGRDDQFPADPLCFGRFGKDCGVERVVRVGNENGGGQSSDWALGDATPDTAGDVGEDVGITVVGVEDPVLQADVDEGSLLFCRR